MEAKDTVMSQNLINTWSGHSRQALCKAQAEISFRAGIEFAEMAIQHQLLEVVEASKKAGRREVVEFVDDLIIGIDNCKFEERLDGDKGCIVLDLNENQWQAQKKKWGIK